MIDFPNNIARISVIGDLHCNQRYGVAAIQYAVDNGAEFHIQLGDFGYRFPDSFLDALQDACQRTNTILGFVEGNHEDYGWLLSQEKSPDGIRRLRERVWHLPRGFRWSWQGVNFLALGGAVSVDQKWRVPGAEWWPEEEITAVDVYRATDGGPTDVMFCHDAPTSAPVPLGDGGWIPPEILYRAQNHRALLQFVVGTVRPKNLFHGHYHVKYDGYAQGVHYHGLDCDGEPFENTVSVVNVLDLGV